MQTRFLLDKLSETINKPLEYSELKIEHQDALVKIIQTVSGYEGRHDSRLEPLLSACIRKYSFDSKAAQYALVELSKINPSKATDVLSELQMSKPKIRSNTIKRLVSDNFSKEDDVFDFTICARKPSDPKWQEQPYYFQYNKGLVYILVGAENPYSCFVGQSINRIIATQLAEAYLNCWFQEIESLNAKQITGTFKIHIANSYSEAVHLILEHLDPEKWEFKQSHISQLYEYPVMRPQIIYSSDWCKIRFSFHSRGEMHDQTHILSISYGRLHASNNGDTILWNSEPHYCWHNNISLVLFFLDDLHPEDTAKNLWGHPIIVDHNKSKETLNISQPASELEKHSTIWNHYGQRLFEVFDLRHPDLWEKYSSFVKKVSKFSRYSIPHEKIC